MAIKKGKRDGTTFLAQRVSPFFAANKFVCEKITRNIKKSVKQIVKIFLLIMNINDFLCLINAPLISFIC